MTKWEYLTVLVKQRQDKILEVIQVNNQEAKPIEEAGYMKTAIFYDLGAYLTEAGQEGWEVAGLSPTTSAVPSSGIGESRITVLVVLKRPISD